MENSRQILLDIEKNLNKFSENLTWFMAVGGPRSVEGTAILDTNWEQFAWLILKRFLWKIFRDNIWSTNFEEIVNFIDLWEISCLKLRQHFGSYQNLENGTWGYKALKIQWWVQVWNKTMDSLCLPLQSKKTILMVLVLCDGGSFHISILL